MLDEFAACGIEAVSDIKELFVDPFFFGCEADDPLTSMAFNTKVNPFGAELNAMMGSDIAHWDVPDMTEVLARGLGDGRARVDRQRRLREVHVHEPGAGSTPAPIPPSSRGPRWRRPSTASWPRR